MVSKILKSLNSINPFSSKIIIYGCLFALILCLSGISLVTYNNSNAITNTVHLYKLGSNMIYTSIVLFTEIVIGSLIIDFFSNTMHKNDD